MELLKDKLSGRRLILASHSPRRRELLAGAGLDFVIADGYEVNEDYPEELPPEEVAEYLASIKSRAYPYTFAVGDLLLTADTVVLCGEKVLGKPAGRDEAVNMLSELSGRRHTVITGVSLRDAVQMRTFPVSSRVWFRSLRMEEIEYYVDNYKPYDKAGSYGIQEWIGYVAIEKIEGSFYNVMGLPIQTLYAELGRFVDGR